MQLRDGRLLSSTRRTIPPVEPADATVEAFRELGREVFEARHVTEVFLRRDADERAFVSLMLCEGEIGNGLPSGPSRTAARRPSSPSRGQRASASTTRLLIHALSALWDQLEEDPGDRFDAIGEEWLALEPDLERRLHEYVQARAGG